MKRGILTLTTLLLTLLASTTRAQEFKYNIDFGFNFDNLESSTPYESTRTLLSAKVAPEIGVMIDGKHKFMIGGNLTQYMGDSEFPSIIDFTLYYNFQNRNFNTFLGLFPRSNSKTSYPRSFFRDDYLFYDANIEGIMAQYLSNNKKTTAELFFDWYGIDHEQNIDEFLIVGSFRQQLIKKRLAVGADILLNHFLNEPFLIDCYLLERFQSNIYISTDLSDLISDKMSLFEIKAALLTSSENKRLHQSESRWQHSPGFQIGLDAIYRGFGLSNDYYRGAEQLIYYSQYGTEFYPGSTFYNSGNYNRTNIYYVWNNRFLSVRADLIFHITPTTFANQQMLTLKANIGGRRYICKNRHVHSYQQ